MTGYTVHTGSNEKFAKGWDQIFKKKGRASKAKSGKPAAAKSRSTKKRKQ